ncbi:hypothetical protein Flavo103_08540 [Flavobacterium collinsii]|uniref:hypothetical protein n=1 Tax=Flavobacterium collinsii TaxID=1114861 RepID=UPI0022CCD275|nr:hypothetical protein [Flavobacterium collinsii]GIQ57718.1 hypothetical protein Flavo103_08540 [Flavobacterium collinsii]
MRENKPTIEEVSDLFIPKQFRECFIITEITPKEIFVDIKKIDTDETKLFLEHFMQITKMMSIKLNIKKNI